MQTQDKQEQLMELLAGYTFSGLPRIPDLLTLGRPHYDQSAFFLEQNWTDIVEGHQSLTKRQRDQQEAIWELLNTEVGYITQLRGVIDVRVVCLVHV
jgi:pleckstrin homology domain-containing family G member 5